MRSALVPTKRILDLALGLLALAGTALHANSKAHDLAAQRSYYLNDLIRPHNYSAGKNSFLLQKLHRGDRKTVLRLGGSGSIRHIWSTWSIPGDSSDIPAPGRILIRVFVDGQSQPSVFGPLDEISKAAEATGSRFAPLAAFNYRGAFNFYLPIFFEHGIRVEIEATDEIEEFYAQIDYRTGNDAQQAPRLVSARRGNLITLNYTPGLASWRSAKAANRGTAEQSKVLEYGERPGEITIQGPGILRQLTLRGEELPGLELKIYWDKHDTPDVEAPLRYFFADFANAAVESGPGWSTCYFPMPFRKQARIVLSSLSGTKGQVEVDYSFEPRTLSAQTLYFRAQYQEAEKTLGYTQYSVLQTQGEGLFVGMNLFDSGHNHGGGDAALIDAGSLQPSVLHGICGEDYFGFAWHRFGVMTLLTGAPAHERRYRLHLENPYPFHESFQLLFGAFAGQHPKSVAFWYQAPDHVSEHRWRTLNVPWKILGPVGLDTSLPEAVSDDVLRTVVPINQPTELSERWQDAQMRSGFLDATYQFRHYVMTERGTGFVVGAGKTRVITHVYSPSRRIVEGILGHDDRAAVRLNGNKVAEAPTRSGFGPFRLRLPLHTGWNTLEMTINNDEGVNWRWCGISLALDRLGSRDLQFSTSPANISKR